MSDGVFKLASFVLMYVVLAVACADIFAFDMYFINLTL